MPVSFVTKKIEKRYRNPNAEEPKQSWKITKMDTSWLQPVFQSHHNSNCVTTTKTGRVNQSPPKPPGYKTRKGRSSSAVLRTLDRSRKKTSWLRIILDKILKFRLKNFKHCTIHKTQLKMDSDLLWSQNHRRNHRERGHGTGTGNDFLPTTPKNRQY